MAVTVGVGVGNKILEIPAPAIPLKVETLELKDNTPANGLELSSAGVVILYPYEPV